MADNAPVEFRHEGNREHSRFAQRSDHELFGMVADLECSEGLDGEIGYRCCIAGLLFPDCY